MQVCVPATIKKILTMSDRGIRLYVDSREIEPETFTEIYRHKDKEGFFFFYENQIREIDTSKLPEVKLDKEDKSPSQRLRGVLFIYHEQNIGNKQSFEDFYKESMEKFIESVKSKLI